MRNIDSKIKKERYDFSNPESQKLFSEFTILLADITRYVEKKEQHIVYLEKELGKEMRIRDMVKIIIRKLSKTCYRFISYIPRKIVEIIKK